MPKTTVFMESARPKTQKSIFGLLIFFGLVDGAIRWGTLPTGFTLCNSGIALSIPLPANIIWLGIGIFLGVAGYQTLRQPISSTRLAWFAVFLGGLINGFDRFFRGCVTDYLHLPFFPSFNLADIMLFLGVTFLVLGSLGIYPKMKSYVS